MADRLSINYDKRRDVLYVSRGDGGTLNLPFTHNQDVQLDEESYDVVGYIITNFSHVYPSLFSRLNPKDRWFVREYFEGRIRDWNSLLSHVRGLKARINFLKREKIEFHGSAAHR